MKRLKPTTARAGDPNRASRGAAVRRAKQALGDAIDRRLGYDFEQAELALLASVIGAPMAEVRNRLKVATLAELEAWIALVERRRLDRDVQSVQSHRQSLRQSLRQSPVRRVG